MFFLLVPNLVSAMLISFLMNSSITCSGGFPKCRLYFLSVLKYLFLLLINVSSLSLESSSSVVVISGGAPFSIAS